MVDPKVERDEHCQAVLAARMADGMLDRAPVVPDIITWEPSQEVADQAEGLVGGFPCQVSRFHFVGSLSLLPCNVAIIFDII